MDPRRFDSLLRSLTTTRSRRGALTTLLGGPLGLLGLADTVAKKKRKKRGKSKKKKGGNPPPPPTGCPAGTAACGGVCINTATDPLNCGACGKRCQVNATCNAGACSCGGACGDPNFSCAEAATNTCACAASGDPTGRFFDPGIPDFVTGCPTNRQCIGLECQACCPTGSTCDPSTGTCLQ